MPYDENGDWEDLYGDDYDEEYLDSDWEDDEPYEDDVWADSDTLSSAGWGTDEDYGYYGDDEGY